jgi:abhydrolase domain-containing protein 6
MPSRSRSLLRLAAALAAVVVIGLIVLYAAFPGVLARGAILAQRSSFDFIRQEVDVPDGTVAYLEGGSGEPLVLLHGFAADKDSWFPMAGQLAEGYRVIIPDLPGFGETTVDAGGDYRPLTQAARVYTFLQALDTGPVHLAGWSMGGHIAGLLAHDHPEVVRSLILLVTGGIATDSVTPVWAEVLAGRRSLLASTRAQLDTALTTVLEVRDPVPGFFKRAILQNTRRRRATWDSVFRQTRAPESRSSLDAVAPGITVPTLVLWGERDVLLHVAMGRRLAARIPGATFVALPQCGHGCPLSDPEATVAPIQSFLDPR